MSLTKTVEFSYSLKKVNVVDGKEVISSEKKTATVDITQFESVSDIIAHYEAIEAGKGEASLVEEINNSFRTTAIANKRAELTRLPLVPKIIQKNAKEMLNEDEQAQLFATLAKLGLKMQDLK